MPGVVVGGFLLHSGAALRELQVEAEARPPPLPSAPPEEKPNSTLFETHSFPKQRGEGPRSYPGDALLPPPAAGCPRCPY